MGRCTVTAVGNREAILSAPVRGATFLAKGYFTPNFVVSYPALGDDAPPYFFPLQVPQISEAAPSLRQGHRIGATSPVVASDGVGITPAHEADHGTGSRVAAAAMGARAPRRWAPGPHGDGHRGPAPGRGAMRGPRTVMAGTGRAAAAPGVSAGARQQRGAGRPPGEMISGAPGSWTGRSRR